MNILRMTRNNYPKRIDLVNRGVGAVTPTREAVKEHFAVEFIAEPPGKPAIARWNSGFHSPIAGYIF
jgi:hypothetical protein